MSKRGSVNLAGVTTGCKQSGDVFYYLSVGALTKNYGECALQLTAPLLDCAPRSAEFLEVDPLVQLDF